MERFDLEVSTANLISLFDKASFEGTVAILEWFYKASNYKGLFESEFADTIYRRLLGRGYSEVMSPKEELESFKSLMFNSREYDSEKIGFMLISLILKNIKEKKGLSLLMQQFITMYNEIYNKENTFAYMMENLEKTIGKDIVFVVIRKGQLHLRSGILEEVEPFQSITVNGRKYPFIGYDIEINKISDSNGTILFSNNLASLNDSLKDFSIIEKKKLKLFGRKV